MTGYTFPNAGLLQMLEIDVAGDPCDLARQIHIKAISKLAQIDIDCEDQYVIENQRTDKPRVVRMLKELAEWSALYYYECGDPEVGSFRPDPASDCLSKRSYDSRTPY